MGRHVLPKSALNLLLSCSLFIYQTGPLLAEEISQDYLDAWHQAESIYFKERLQAYGHSESIAVAELAKARAALIEAEKAKGSTPRVRARRSEQFVLKTLEKIRSELQMVKTAITIIDELKETGFESHVAVPSRRIAHVFLTSNGKKSALPAQLKQGDSVETVQEGLLEFVSTDGSIIQIGSNSSMLFESIDGNSSSYLLTRGKLHGLFHCIEVPALACREFKISTPGLSGTLRGTELVMEILPTGEQRVIVMAGMVELDRVNGGTPIRLSKGTMMQLSADGVMHGPFDMKLNWVKRWWE